MRLAAAAGVAAAALTLAGCGSAAKTPAKPSVWPGSAATHPGRGPSHLTVATDTSVLPLNLLVADGDDRLVSLSPRGQVVWHLRQGDPTQVFVSRTGRTLVIAEEQRALVLLRRVDNHFVAWRYGRSNVHGSAPGELDAPASALETRSGAVVIADPGDCTVVLATTASERPLLTLGTPGVCAHDPPASFARPDAAFPAPGGELVVTEQRPAWIDVLGAHDRLLHAVSLRGFSAPSDASAYGAAGLVVADRTDPGAVEELDRASGSVLWHYAPTSGPRRLDDPAQASVLADGDVLVVDSGNDRVIVIDPHSDTIVWQYGHTAVAGTAAGYLDDPGSATLVPLGP